MPRQLPRSPHGRITKPLVLSEFEGLAAELKLLRGSYANEAILGFVRGLRLSARIIYFLRKHLSHLPLEVDWGHLVGPDGNYLSRECDIIIHKAGCIEDWNGHDKPIMHFRFIQSQDAIAVVSCKSYLASSSKVDSQYCSQMNPYVNYIFLFAECCPKAAARYIERRAKLAGYKEFGYLYSFNKETSEAESNPAVWEFFLKAIRETCEERTH